MVFLHRPELAWDAAAVIAAVRGDAHAVPDTDALLAQLQSSVRSGDHVVFMSNGGFDGAPRRFLAAGPMSGDGSLPLFRCTPRWCRVQRWACVFERRYLDLVRDSAAAVRDLVSA